MVIDQFVTHLQTLALRRNALASGIHVVRTSQLSISTLIGLVALHLAARSIDRPDVLIHALT
jgi:hypothetical protein